MRPAVRVGATGFGLIAVCYGFARFAFGLFLPQIRQDLALSPALAGMISGGAFLAYCVAIVVAARASERIGARAVAIAAALVASVGMLGIAVSPSPLCLAVFVVLAGASTGLASPPMAHAVAHAVAETRQNATNTMINAGTSAGVALSGPVALVMGQAWRTVFVLFAATALALAVAAFLSMPGETGKTSRHKSQRPRADVGCQSSASGRRLFPDGRLEYGDLVVRRRNRGHAARLGDARAQAFCGSRSAPPGYSAPAPAGWSRDSASTSCTGCFCSCWQQALPASGCRSRRRR